jgi:hypothetical protein
MRATPVQRQQATKKSNKIIKDNVAAQKMYINEKLLLSITNTYY